MKRFPLFLLAQATCFAQGIITTVAGTDYIFADDGQPAAQAHLVAPSGVAVDGKTGDIYVADFGLNMVLRIDSKGIIHVVAGNGLRTDSGDGGPARAASIAAPIDLARSAAALFIADLYGTCIRSVTPAGIIGTLVGNGGGFSGDGGPASKALIGTPFGVATDANSGVLYIADAFNARVRKIDTNGIISTLAGNGQNTSSGDGGPAAAASLAFPYRVTVDGSGNVYIAQVDGRIRKVTAAGIISTFAQGLAQPMGMVVDSTGNLVVCEQNAERIVSIAPNGAITVIAGSGGNGFGDGPAASAIFSRPVAIDKDLSGSFYVADQDNGRIRKISNGSVLTIAGVGAYTGDGGPATQARLNFQQGVVTDATGNLYIADGQNNRIRKVTPGGVISTVVGTGRQGFSPDGTPGTAALISSPQAVGIDAQGNLVYADGNDRIRRLNADGSIVTIAGSGSGISSGDGGPATSAGFGFPQCMVFDSAGNLYFAEDTRVRKISTTGTITAFAGTGQSGNSGDGGPATSATFGNIRGLAVDASGNVYIGDNASNLVRRVNPSGIITTVAGNGKSGFDPGPGPATSIPLNYVYGLAADPSGNVYISENFGLIVRRLDPKGTLTIYAGSQRVGTSGDGGSALAAAFDDIDQLYCDRAGNLYISDARAGRIRVVQAGPSPSIVASQKGLTFSAVAGSGGAPQTFTIVNGGQGTLNWGVTASTASGGNWLSATPASGASTAGAAGPLVQVSVNPAGLAAADYYGQIAIGAEAAPNTPQSVTVVLNVRAAGSAGGTSVQPSGLLFTATAGAPVAPASQSFTLTTFSTSALSYSTTATAAQIWFTVQSASGSVSAGKPATVNILPNIAGLLPGVYNGNITFAFSDNSAQQVQLLLVVSPVTTTAGKTGNAAGNTCTPATLLPLFTSLGSGFSLTTGWPSPVEVRVVDDCANPLTGGSVIAAFSNGDPALNLTSLGDGRWTGTWQAQSATANASITANAQSADRQLKGSSSVSGGLQQNANPPPSIAAGGVLNAASYSLKASQAPGSLISIFGSQLSQGAVQAPALPLPTTLGQTTITIAGRKLPLLYAGANQVNAMIPYDLPINATHQAVVQRGTTISVPEPIGVLSSQSGVFTKNLTGTGAGIVVKVATDGTQSIVTTDNPAHAYDALVIYCAGLGDVNPRQLAGSETPFSPLSNTLDAVKVTIGGVDAPVFFGGLTPGFTGLYQVNAYVPTGVAPGDDVPLLITQAGRTSPPVSISVR